LIILPRGQESPFTLLHHFGKGARAIYRYKDEGRRSNALDDVIHIGDRISDDLPEQIVHVFTFIYFCRATVYYAIEIKEYAIAIRDILRIQKKIVLVILNDVTKIQWNSHRSSDINI